MKSRPSFVLNHTAGAMLENIKPKVSIVTPVYNGERFLERTLKSVRAQTYQNIEHIIVDGASKDGTMSILEKYREGISTLISEPDKGMYDAINKGFSRATGSILCYLNSDDLFEPDAVASSVDALIKSDSGISIGNCIFIDENDRELFRYRGVALDYQGARQLCRIPFAQQTAFWTRRLYDLVGGFDSNFKYVADSKFFLRALQLSGKRPVHVNRYVARFRLHSEAFSSKAASAMAKEHMQVLADLNISPGLMRAFQELRIKFINSDHLVRKIWRAL